MLRLICEAYACTPRDFHAVIPMWGRAGAKQNRVEHSFQERVALLRCTLQEPISRDVLG